MTLKIFGLTQKTNLQPIKLLQQKWREGAISTESASEADSSDQRSQIKLAIKKWQIVFMIGNHIWDPNKRMGLMLNVLIQIHQILKLVSKAVHVFSI